MCVQSMHSLVWWCPTALRGSGRKIESLVTEQEIISSKTQKPAGKDWSVSVSSKMLELTNVDFTASLSFCLSLCFHNLETALAARNSECYY